MSHCQSKYLPPRRVGCWSRLERGWGPDSCVVHLCVIEWNSGNKKSHYPPAKPTVLNKKALDGGSPSGVGPFLRPPHPVSPRHLSQGTVQEKETPAQAHHAPNTMKTGGHGHICQLAERGAVGRGGGAAGRE